MTTNRSSLKVVILTKKGRKGSTTMTTIMTTLMTTPMNPSKSPTIMGAITTTIKHIPMGILVKVIRVPTLLKDRIMSTPKPLLKIATKEGILTRTKGSTTRESILIKTKTMDGKKDVEVPRLTINTLRGRHQ
mmetsp:Transcript_4838/g.7281  ORF Transcript_4838/g.7281 Transcript_4838/m.7281 type:complete len:132 (-) Transcript_4838:132-527(-)